MRTIAIGLLLIILASILIEPLVEISLVMKDKIALGTSLSNAARSAKDRSLQYEAMRGLDAKVDPERFKDYFSEAFGAAMNASLDSRSGDTLRFRSNNGKWNDIVVTLDIAENEDPSTERTVTKVEVSAESDYRFKTKYLRAASGAGTTSPFRMKMDRELLLSVKN